MGVPNNGWFIREYPSKKDDDWGYPYDSGNHHRCINGSLIIVFHHHGAATVLLLSRLAPLNNDCTNGVRYSCPSSKEYVKEQSDDQDCRGSSAEAKSHTAEDVRNLSRKRNASIQESSEGFEHRSP